MKHKVKRSYRLSYNFEHAGAQEQDAPTYTAAIQEAWRLAGRPQVTRVVILAAVEDGAFKPQHTIK